MDRLKELILVHKKQVRWLGTRSEVGNWYPLRQATEGVEGRYRESSGKHWRSVKLTREFCWMSSSKWGFGHEIMRMCVSEGDGWGGLDLFMPCNWECGICSECFWCLRTSRQLMNLGESAGSDIGQSFRQKKSRSVRSKMRCVRSGWSGENRMEGEDGFTRQGQGSILDWRRVRHVWVM